MSCLDKKALKYLIICTAIPLVPSIILFCVFGETALKLLMGFMALFCMSFAIALAVLAILEIIGVL